MYGVYPAPGWPPAGPYGPENAGGTRSGRRPSARPESFLRAPVRTRSADPHSATASRAISAVFAEKAPA
ncbi:hypothetical protein STVIR_7462 [Streptomyces viridochromogenes Tue57]|uniref:Uncharacterized protein n=1 Tax=Streptomyces viridochromogenes Tue57 TaxID=1160705 RepID=L8P532_STRVR|nr:hypothetical protein STVIR_7462 [Streptomyces viridochromogenes Tue57]